MHNSTSVARKPNRLIKEKSPYLLQHAYNPVDWYPWGPEAFEKAKENDRPVFVSIGYSTCHWCHVMEKECFDDDQVAELMNQTFVSIKVDREERPDLDAAYMAVCQAMGRNCGWPLNVIMSPEKNPFFVASYIPKDNRYGTVGMLSLVPQIKEIWKTRKAEMETIGKELKKQIKLTAESKGENLLGKSDLENAFDQLFLRFDPENGGFGTAPKFPSPHNLMFLLRYWSRTKDKTAWNMVEKTLRAMRLGGIFDQLGFGFHRYSTDAQWLVPHFEKMLYDQALLTLAYVEAFQASGEQKFRITAQETLDYVLRDLASPERGFYSAEDADTEGEEGKFYIWSYEEIKQALPQEDADLAIKIFDIQPGGNYFEPHGNKGKNILHFNQSLEQLALERKLTIEELIGKLGKIRNILFRIREKRIHPAKDNKILVDWNGLMIASLARAGQVFGNQKYIDEASKAADFILEDLKNKDGKLFHRYVEGEKAILGFLDDYAFFTFGLIELYEAGFEEKYLLASVELTKKMVSEFWDNFAGGFFFSAKEPDETVPRIKQVYDGAAPSGNSVALLNLIRLAQLVGEVSFEKYAKRLIEAFAEETKSQPLGHTFLLTGLDFVLGPTFNVVLVGDRNDPDTSTILKALRKSYNPNLTIRLLTSEKARAINYEKIDNKTTAYVCRGQTCMPPTNSVEKIVELTKLD